jgi:signal transduction histidine kinase
MVHGLRAPPRPARLAFKPLRVSALLERTVELYETRIDAQRIDVQREYARDLPTIFADHDALYQALVNLVTNALDAMPNGGVLVLRTAWSDGESLGGRRGGRARRVAIEIQDSGVGMSPVVVGRIFNPFFSTKDGGTGLGLSLAHKIVDDHEGSLDVRSTPGAGTTFRLVLPLMPQATTEPGHDALFG